MEQEDELKNTFIEEYTSSEILKDMGKLKSSVILVSKSLFALCDYLIFIKYKKLPKNHSERFRILELKEPLIYKEVDAIWSRYTDTYSKPSNKEAYGMLKNTIIKISKDEIIDKEIKEIIGQ